MVDKVCASKKEKIASKYYLQCLQEKDSFFVDLRDGKLVKDKTYKPVGEVVAL